MGVRKVGVEEELLLVDPRSGVMTAVAQRAVRADREESGDTGPEVEAELFLQQIETMTEPCTDLDDLADQVRAGRAALRKAAEQAGAAAVAVPVPVLVDDRRGDADVTPKPRYRRIQEEYGELARTALACAMHMHVDVDDPEEGVRVLDGIAPWLPVLLAVSANSPYSRGVDTGYASWRTQVWSRWPSHGTGEPFGSLERYEEVTGALLDWGAALDDGMLYFDARLSSSYPTVELRVADVCTDVDDAVLVAALARALVTTAAAEAEPQHWRGEMVRAATWRAARDGTTGRLVHPGRRELAPAREVLTALVDHVADALEAAGDRERVGDLVAQVLSRGNGAVQQRRAFEQTGDLGAVVRDLAERTGR